MNHESIHKTVIPCDCTCGVVMLWEFEQWGTEPHQLMADWSVSYPQGRLRNRLKVAWRVLRGKDPWMHSILLQEDGIKQLRETVCQIALDGDAA